MSIDDPPTAEEEDRNPDGVDEELLDDEEPSGLWGGYPIAGWWPTAFYDTEPEAGDEPAAGTGDVWLDDGLSSLLVIAGAVLFIVPEPVTSAVGVVLLAAGVALWILG